MNLGVLRSLSIYILGLLDIHAAWQPKLVEVKCCRCRLLYLHLLPLRTELIIPFLLRRRLLLLPILFLALVAECLPCLLHVVHVAEALVVYPQLELVPVLHDVEHVVPDVERVLEGRAELLDLEDQLGVSVHLLFPRQMRTDELDRHFFRVQAQLPGEDRF